MTGLYHALRAIEMSDPDGWECEPTEADYAEHEQWAVSTYGWDVWDAYTCGGWGE